MGELGSIIRYSYWSDRRVHDIATNNNINLDRRWLFGFKTPNLGFLPQAEIADKRRNMQRHERAKRIELAIGQLAVEDFVNPVPSAYAKGHGGVTFAAYTRWRNKREKTQNTGVILHTRTEGSDGSRIEVCLFGSIEHCTDYLPGSEVAAPMWRASSTPAIEEFIAHQGNKKAPIYDDDESIAVEILRTFNNEGMTGRHVFKSIQAAEWFAEVFHDVELDKKRWNLKPGKDLPEPVDRIIVGAPLWVRSYRG